ncbi:MAG: MmcQ/YjbR family DNA-binding protein [Nocardiopsaceae bacterium]|jgi:hypothetical protein|nr:MmcQ/YjbR family DNA-binding protein [Nocardiopsaceae bacterium]
MTAINAEPACWHHVVVANQNEDRDDRVTIEDVRAWAIALPRTEEHLIRDYVKFRVGPIVYAAVSPDETILGFGFPKEERAALIAAEPERFLLERRSDARYNWIDARMATLSLDEAREFITDAWRMVVPKRVAAQIG